jgi:hypothetical protein
MIEDLNDDIAILKRMEENHMFRFYALNYILKFAGMSKLERDIPEWTPNRIWNESIPDTFNRDFLNLSFVWIQRTGNLQDYNSSSFEEMKNTGLYSFIKNRPLKTALIGYYKIWGWRIGTEHIQGENSWIEKWYDVLAQDGIYHTSLIDHAQPLSYIKEYPYRGVIITRITGTAAWRYNTSIILQEKAEGLITQIEEEIDKY